MTRPKCLGDITSPIPPDATPVGQVMFVSRLFIGAISDSELTKQSGFLTKFVPGDQVIANKGFVIADIFMDVGHLLCYLIF